MKAESISMKFPPTVLAQIDDAAKQAGLSRLKWLMRAIENQLRLDRVQEGLRWVDRSVTEKCRHPIGRRIGNRCADCGAVLGKS